MSVQLRSGTAEDAQVCGRICYDAFGAISSAHGFPNDFPSAEVAVGLLGGLLGHPGFYSVVAERDGQVIGSNFLDERSTIAGVGPITVDPAHQDTRVGRVLMEDVIRRARERAPGARLLQAAYHGRSLSLYAKLGFAVRDVLACMQGPAMDTAVPGYRVRAGTAEDAAACNDACRRVHGHDRSGEVADAVAQAGLLVVEHDGRISGYSTGLAFFAHSVGETNEDLKALIGAAPAFAGPGILVPARNSDLFGWCLNHGLRVVQLMTLMTIGLYNEPEGSYMPSVLY
jgi:GNAT superfamily N-acetyltransferase